MHTNTVPNWMLYDLIRSMKDDMDRKFSEIKEDISEFRQQHKEDITRLETRIDRLETRIDKLEVKFDKLEAKVEKLDEKIEKLNEKVDNNTQQINELLLNREKIQISFSKTFAFANIFFSVLIAYLAALFTWKIKH